MAWLTMPLMFALGAFVWSFAEYGLHNWRGHGSKGKNEFSREHLQHHARGHWFAPTHKKVKAALLVAAVMLPASALAVGWLNGGALTAGFTLAYIGYEVLHRRLHTHPPKGAYGRWARRHHFYHHFTKPNDNHGVTSPLWDHVFGTHAEPGLIRVPAKLAMPWLVDPATGEVYERFAGDYVVARRGDKARAAAAEDAEPSSLDEGSMSAA